MSRKQIFVGIMILALTLGIEAGYAQLKIGYINSQKMLLSYPAAVTAQRQLQQDYSAVETELKRMEQDLVTKQQELAQQSLLLSEQKKAEKQQELQDLYTRLQEYRQSKQDELTRKQDQLMQPILDELNTAIQKMGTDESYDFIFDSVQGNLLFAQKKYDLTDLLLQRLEKKPAEAAKPADK